MKKLNIVILLIFIHGILLAQTLKTSVFSSGGGATQTAGYSHFGTFGQPLSVGTIGTSYQSKEGFIFAQQNSVSVTITADQTICYNTAAATLNSVVTGSEGEVTYQWQVQNLTLWEDVPGATTNTCNPGILTAEKSFRLLVDDKSGIGQVTSNTVTISIAGGFSAGAIASDGETICNGGNPAQIGSTLDASGGIGTITYAWYSSTNNFVDSVLIADATTTVYDPPSGLTEATSYRRYAHDATCHPGFEVSSGTWDVSLLDAFNAGAIETTGETICYNADPAEIGSVTDATGGNESITYAWYSSTNVFTDSTLVTGAASPTYNPPAGLQTSTSYRRYAKDGICNVTPVVSTGTWTVTVNPDAVAGAVTGGTTVCSGTPSGTLTLGGYSGAIVKWQWSVNPFSSWNDTLITASAFVSKPLTETTQFRAAVQSGSGCPLEFSTPTTVTVIATVAGAVSGTSPVCTGSNSGELTLTGQTGSVIRWQSAVSPFTSWTNIANTATTYTSGNLTENTRFRAVVKNGSCPALSSTFQLITVNPVSVGGSIASVPEICSGTKPANLVLSGNTGSVVRWEKSADALFTTPTTIASTATTLTGTTIGNLTENTCFRAVVKSGACAETNSDYVLVTVNPPTVAGSVSGPSTWVCSGSNSGMLTLAGQTGEVVKWQYAVQVASVWTWSDIAHTATTYTSGPLTESTRFRAVVQSGACALAYSGFKLITVRANPTFTDGTVSTPNCYGADVEFTANGLLPDINNTFNYEVTIGSTVINGTKNAISDASGAANYSESGIGEGTYSFKLNTIVVAGCTTAITDPAVDFIVLSQFLAGTITSTGETICYNEDPSEIGSITAASGGDGTITYAWYKSTDDFTDSTVIATAESASYNPPSGLTETTSYRRYAHDGTCNTPFEVSAGTWTVTVYGDFTPGTISSTGETICHNGNPAEIGSMTAASGGDNTITYQWKSSTDNFATPGTLIAGAVSPTYNPPTGLQTTTSYRRYAHDGTCNTSFEVSAGTWLVTVYDAFTPGTITSTGETICYDSDPAEISNETDASGGDENITYEWRSSADGFNSAIYGATGEAYTPGTLTQTTTYRRYAHDGTCHTLPEQSVGEWTVTVEEIPETGTLTKSPDLPAVCDGDGVSATLTPGSGGNGTDELESRTRDGAGWSAWSPYLSGSNISSVGKMEVEIRTRRMADYCTNAGYETVSWTVTEIPTLSVSVSIVATRAPGGQVKFTATPVNGGANPTYKWFKNNVEIPGATGPELITTCHSGDEHHVVLTSSIPCTQPATSGGMCTL